MNKSIAHKAERKKLIKELDKIVGDWIKKRDGWTCQRCGSTTKQLNACHFYSREGKAIRWEPLNITTLCVGCHFWGHKNPLGFVRWYSEKMGKEKMDILELKKRNRLKTSLVNLQMIKQIMLQQIQEGTFGEGSMF